MEGTPHTETRHFSLRARYLCITALVALIPTYLQLHLQRSSLLSRQGQVDEDLNNRYHPRSVLLEPPLGPLFHSTAGYLGGSGSSGDSGSSAVSSENDDASMLADDGKKFGYEIRADDEELYEKERYKFLKWMEKHDLMSKEKYDPLDDVEFPRKCMRPQWTYEMFQNCNLFHDLSYDRLPPTSSGHQYYDIQYLSHGAFRDSFLFEPADAAAAADADASLGLMKTPFVVKNKRYERELDRRDVYKIDTEALIMERLSASPRTSNIYGHCGSSIMVEKGREISRDIVPHVQQQRYRGYIPQHDLDQLQLDDVYPMNNFTNDEKLDIAIQIAESLAEMHGYVGGVMTNDDIALGQWLYSMDGRAILNDFNDAMYVEWNYKKKEYCQYWRKFGGAAFKAPEVMDGSYLDESVDIWPMGNILYTLLTGLYPHYDLVEDEDIEAATKEGPPYLDPRYKTRSFIEGRMVGIMNKCHKLTPSERVDIFEVVRHLRETQKLAKKGVVS